MENILTFLQTYWYWILIGIAGLILLLKFLPRYRIAPPDRALIISGLIRRNYKVRNPDGTIDGEKSVLVYQDQQTAFTEKQQSNGTAIRIQGGLEKETTFAKLFKGGYIPFQIAELIGEAPIEKATASLDCSGGSISVSALSKATLTANYAIATVTATVTAPDGSQLFRYTVKADGICKYEFSLASIILPSTFNQYAAGDNTVTVKCRVSTGEEFAVYTGTLITT